MLSSSLLRRCLLGVALTVTVVPAAPVQWTAASGGNDNWYEIVLAPSIFQGVRFDTARAGALASTHMGLNGYLATVTSAGEQAFIKNNLTFLYGFGATSTAFLGATDLAVHGQYRWLDGPEAGQLLTYSNWGNGQPASDGEYLAFGMNAQTVGVLHDYWVAIHSEGGALGYIVEYGDGVPDGSNAVPEPSAFVLSLAGLGALALKMRRR